MYESYYDENIYHALENIYNFNDIFVLKWKLIS